MALRKCLRHPLAVARRSFCKGSVGDRCLNDTGYVEGVLLLLMTRRGSRCNNLNGIECNEKGLDCDFLKEIDRLAGIYDRRRVINYTYVSLEGNAFDQKGDDDSHSWLVA